MTLDQWRARYEELNAEAARLRTERNAARAEAAKLQSLIDLQQTRMDAANTLWQDAHPEKEHLCPDLGDLLAWLMQEWDAKLKENSQLRLVLATSNAKCAYCGLPAEEMAKCASGFPGCARGDDMLSDDTPTRRELVAERDAAEAERDAAQAEAARAVEALRKLSERVAISAKDSFGTCDEWLDSFRLNFPDECAAYEEAVAVLSASEPALDWFAKIKLEAITPEPEGE